MTPLVKFKDLSPENRKDAANLILSRYEKEETIADIAQEMGVSPRGIYGLLLHENPERWKHAQAARLLHELDEAKQGMRTAKDHLELARWDKLAARHQWELERLSNRIYGQRPEPEQTPPVQINISLRESGSEKVVSEQRAETTVPLTIKPSKPSKKKAVSIQIHAQQESVLEPATGQSLSPYT